MRDPIRSPAPASSPTAGTAPAPRRPVPWRWLAAAALLVVACGAVLPLMGERTPGVPTAVVEADPFVRRIPADGNLRAVDSTLIAVPTSIQQPMRIAWLAEDGSRVAAGDPVVRFDPTDLEKELEDAESQRARTELKVGQERISREAELDKLEKDTRLAEMKLEQAREFQKKDDVIFSRHEIIESEIDEELASEEMEHASSSRRTRETLSDAELELLAIERRRADLSYDRAREGLDSLTIAAPHDGLVVFRRNWRGDMPRVGETVYAGFPLADIPELARMEAQVYVLEADAGGLEEGLPARVLLEAFPERTFEATVASVDNLAKPRRRGSPVQYFAVVLSLEETVPELMKEGQRVRAWIYQDEMDAAITVPRQAVFEVDGETVVYRRDGDGFAPVPVELGPTAMGRVVIAAGLETGDEIALADPTEPLDDGTGEEAGDGDAGPAGLTPGGMAP